MDAFERTHFLFSEESRCTIGIMAKVAHPLCFDRIKEGVYALTKRHILLRSTIAKGSFTFKETERLPDVLWIKNTGEDEWNSIFSLLVNQPFIDLSFPLFKVAYLSGQKKTGLILLMHHAIGDGATLFTLLQEVLTYAITGAFYCLPTSWDQTPSVERLVLQALSCQKKEEEINRLQTSAPIEMTQFIYKTLDPLSTRTFLHKIREQKLTFQSVFSAIVLKELFKEKGVEQMAYICPINIRKYLGLSKASLGCQITLLHLLINQKEATSIGCLSHLIHSKLKSLTNHPVALFKNIFNFFSPSLQEEGNAFPRIGMSSVGTLQFSDCLKEIEIQSVYINGSLGPSFAFHPVVCTVDDRLHLTFCFSSSLLPVKQAELLCDKIVYAMQTICAV